MQFSPPERAILFNDSVIPRFGAGFLLGGRFELNSHRQRWAVVAKARDTGPRDAQQERTSLQKLRTEALPISQ